MNKCLKSRAALLKLFTASLICLGLLQFVDPKAAADQIVSNARTALLTPHISATENIRAASLLANEPTFQFSSANFAVNEAASFATITVTRTGDSSVSAS